MLRRDVRDVLHEKGAGRYFGIIQRIVINILLLVKNKGGYLVGKCWLFIKELTGKFINCREIGFSCADEIGFGQDVPAQFGCDFCRNRQVKEDFEVFRPERFETVVGTEQAVNNLTAGIVGSAPVQPFDTLRVLTVLQVCDCCQYFDLYARRPTGRVDPAQGL